MQNEQLTKAAEIIISKMQNPANFLSFLIDAQRWYETLKSEIPPKDKESDRTYHISHFIEMVIIPWMRNEKSAKSAIAKGLWEVLQMDGHEGYYTMCAAITQAFGFELNGGILSEEYSKKCLNGINTMMELSQHLHEFEKIENQDRRAA